MTVEEELAEVRDLTKAEEIAGHVSRILLSACQYPEFASGNVPVKVVAKAIGKDQEWVKAGIISGWLPIGYATKKGRLVTSIEEITSKEKTNFYISPKKLWEVTGFVWRGERE